MSATSAKRIGLFRASQGLLLSCPVVYLVLILLQFASSRQLRMHQRRSEAASCIVYRVCRSPHIDIVAIIIPVGHTPAMPAVRVCMRYKKLLMGWWWRNADVFPLSL